MPARSLIELHAATCSTRLPRRQGPVWPGGRSGSADAGDRQLAEQRSQVHCSGGHIWLDAAGTGPGTTSCRGSRTTASASSGNARACLRALRAVSNPRRVSAAAASALACRWPERLVEMHGGRIHAFSDGPGQGSEFVVRLPRTTSTDNCHSKVGMVRWPSPAPLLIPPTCMQESRTLSKRPPHSRCRASNTSPGRTHRTRFCVRPATGHYVPSRSPSTLGSTSRDESPATT